MTSSTLTKTSGFDFAPDLYILLRELGFINPFMLLRK
jgi:hypothetical protein